LLAAWLRPGIGARARADQRLIHVVIAATGEEQRASGGHTEQMTSLFVSDQKAPSRAHALL
jgi:hypothetical protein